MDKKLHILKTLRGVIDGIIILAIFIDLLISGLSNWILIALLLFIPSNVLYFSIKYRVNKIKKIEDLQKIRKKHVEKVLVIK